jgi:hypothetical protein
MNGRTCWTGVAIFVSKDENLTKAHVRWLESRIVSDILKAKRAESTNGNAPGGNKLPEPDTADMETYYENVRLLLPTLGLNIFEAESTVAPHRDTTVSYLNFGGRTHSLLAS